MESLLPKLHEHLKSWDAYNGTPVFVYFYGGEAHPPYYASRVEPHERGWAPDPLMDVFLALHRRTDQVARELAEIWPPRPRVDGKWKKEHGLAFYLGDHGEQLTGHDPPPHGNLVSPDVSRTLLALEARAWKTKSHSGGLVRMADVYATVAQVVGMEMNGPLFLGRNLLSAANSSQHAAISSFSFYRPG
ncbi:Lysine-specific histone demethylase 1B, partial [Durusdinium trenchii]